MTNADFFSEFVNIEVQVSDKAKQDGHGGVIAELADCLAQGQDPGNGLR